jgi:signal transduction histidine kinase
LSSSTPVLREELGGLAEAMRRAFTSDALLIRPRAATGPQRLHALDGTGEEELLRLERPLAQLLPTIGAAGTLRLPRLATSERRGAAALVEHGYGALLGTVLEFEGEVLAELVVLRREAGPIGNSGLVEAFGRQAAIALVHSRLREQTESLTERLEQFQALDRVALSSLDLDQLSAALHRCLEPIVGAQLTGVMVWDDRRRVLQMVPGSFGADDATAASYQIDPGDPHSNAARVFATGRPYLSNNAAGDPGILQGYVRVFGIKRLISLRLAAGGRPTGVLHLANKATDFRIADLRRIEQLLPRIATAVELTRSVLQLRRREQLEAVLSEVAVAIASGRSILDYLPQALEGLARTLDAGMIALVPEKSEPIVHRRPGERDGLAKIILEEAQAAPGVRAYVVGPRRAGDPGWAVFHTPVHLGRQRIGTLATLRLHSTAFTEDERLALGRLGHVAALGWASESYQRQRAELARLQERQRIADDLHDHVAQILFAAQLGLDETLKDRDLDQEARAAVTRSRALLIRGDTAIREVISELSQPAAGDFSRRLADTVTAVEDEFSMPVHLTETEQAVEAAGRLSPAAAELLLKVVREALVNAAKHAGPCRATVRLEIGADATVRVSVVDDGVGSTSTSGGGHGLASMRRHLESRGGRLNVRRGTGGGTTMTASIASA